MELNCELSVVNVSVSPVNYQAMGLSCELSVVNVSVTSEQPSHGAQLTLLLLCFSVTS